MRNNKRKFKFEFGFMLLLLTSFVLVIITGYLVNQKITTTVEQVSIHMNPDGRLLVMKALNEDLLEAENKIYSFNLTKDRTYLLAFYHKINESDKKIQRLKNFSSKDKYYKNYVNSLEQLVLEKYGIMDSLLKIQNQYRVNEAMEKVLDRVNEVDFQSQSEKITSDQIDEEESKWKRIFKKKSKQEKQVIVPQNQAQKKELDAFKREIGELKQNEGGKEIKNNSIELNLMLADKSIMSKINLILDQLQTVERTNIARKTAQAKVAAIDAKYIVQLYSLIATLILILTAYTIIRYIRKNNIYKGYLKKAKQESEEIVASKVRFFSNMSHEIRTPLNSIIGFSEQLMKERGNLPAESRKQLAIVRNSAEHLSKIVNEILDFSKLQAHKVQLESLPFNPVAEIQIVVQLMQHDAAEKKNSIQLDVEEAIPEILLGDPIKFRQMLLNLISNAVKFTDQGMIHVKLACSKLDDTKVTLDLEVRDTGIGIEDSQLEKIFEEFEQESNATTRNYGGTGLGLSITKMLVDLHQGSIAVNSQKSKGSSFKISLVYFLPTSTPQADPEAENAAFFFKDKKVLIVDDVAYNRKLLVSILEKRAFEINEAGNGQQALELVEVNNFDLILMDLRMPVMGGIEATKAIREHKDVSKRKTFIIALTAGTSDESGDLSGINALLNKPFEEKTLLSLIQDLFSGREVSKTTVEIVPEKPVKELIDLSSLRKLSGQNDSFYTEMIQTFIQTTEEGMMQLEREFQDKNYGQVFEIAHRIASPCKHIGALDLYDLIKKVEHLAQRSELDGLEGVIHQASNHSKLVISALHEEINQL